MLNIISNVLLHHFNIASAINFHLLIYYILLTNFIWILNVTGLVNQRLFI